MLLAKSDCPDLKGRWIMAVTEGLAIILPANQVPGPGQGQWTSSDYAALPDDGRRYELMDGVLLMSPSLSQGNRILFSRLHLA